MMVKSRIKSSLNVTGNSYLMLLVDKTNKFLINIIIIIRDVHMCVLYVYACKVRSGSVEGEEGIFCFV